jgi:magnesium transporter
MKSNFATHARRAGLSPGTLPPDDKTFPDIDLIYYDENKIEERKITSIDDCKTYIKQEGVTWINIEGVRNKEVMEKIGQCFNLHSLLLEDIACGGQRPKVDYYEDHIFIVVQMLEFIEEIKEVKIEQVSFVVGKNYVLSFQEIEGDVFDPNRERLRSNKGKIRKSGTDYLIYSLIDTIVDNYFIILEKTGEKIEDIEMDLISQPSPALLRRIYKLKRDNIFLRKSVWPLREVVSRLERDETGLITSGTKIFLRDVYDHTIEVIETVESYRDILGGMVDMYLSSASNKMNSIIKILTMISTIFIPLTFIVGVYGMNFRNFPELEWKYGYFIIWAIMLGIAISMVIYFRRKRWL